MTKKDFINAIAEKAQLNNKAASAAVDAFVDVVTEALANNDKIQLVGFGTFSVKERAARKGFNPSTGEPVEIPAAKVPTFKAGKKLKDSI